jgi:hypothetical protein
MRKQTKCEYCGKMYKKTDDTFRNHDNFCCKKHQKLMIDKLREYEVLGLCQYGCGNYVYVDESGKRYYYCYKCLHEPTELINKFTQFKKIPKIPRKKL